MNRPALDRRVTVLGSSLLLGLVLAGCQSGGAEPAKEGKEPEAPPVSISTVAAKREDMEVLVTAQGTLAPVQGGVVRLAAPFAGRVQNIPVREGDRVTKGQAVATLENRPLTAQARSAAATYKVSVSQAEQTRLSALAAKSEQESALQTARIALTAAVTERDNAVQAAQTALQLAETDLARIQAGARPQEIAQAEEALKQATATRARAAIEAERQKFLFEKGVSAKRQSEDAETALAVAESAMESARENRDLLKAGARAEDRAMAELRVRQAREGLAQARSGGDAKVAAARAAVQQAEQGRLTAAAKVLEARAAQENVGKAAADVAAARTQEDFTVLRSPIVGLVTRRLANPGDMADTTAPILEITNLNSLDVLASLPAQEGGEVRPGLPAHIRFGEGDAQKAYEARVESVGQVDAQTNLLPVRLRIANADGRLKAGMFAAVEIVVRISHQAVVVPKEAVVLREGKSVVYTVEDDVAHEHKVTTGAEQNEEIEVKGIPAKATVVRVGQYELSDGAKVKVADE